MRTSLPLMIQAALKQHIKDADIRDDDETKTLINKLTELNEKLEAVKMQARANRKQGS